MKTEQLLKSLSREIDEAASLMKAYTEKLKKDGEEEVETEEKNDEPSEQPTEQPEVTSEEDMTPAQEEVVEAAQEGEPVQDILEYAKSLSQDELEGILQVLMDEFEGRASAPEAGLEQAAEGQPMESQPQVPEMTEKADEVDPEMAAIADSESPEQMATTEEQPAQDMQEMASEQPVENQETMSLDDAVSQLSDEEKAKLKAALEAAMSQVAQAPEMEKSVKMNVKKPAAPAPVKVNGSKKAEPSKLAKSVNSVLEKLEKIVPNGLPSNSYASSNNIKVLEKSASEPTYSSGFELANRLLTEQRKGNKLVKSIHVSEANCTSNDKLDALIAKLNSQGINV